MFGGYADVRRSFQHTIAICASEEMNGISIQLENSVCERHTHTERERAPKET